MLSNEKKRSSLKKSQILRKTQAFSKNKKKILKIFHKVSDVLQDENKNLGPFSTNQKIVLPRNQGQDIFEDF